MGQQQASSHLKPGRARQVQGAILGRARNLGLTLSNEARAEILIEETVQTSAIEGEVLNRDSVRSSVIRQLSLDQAGLQDVFRNPTNTFKDEILTYGSFLKNHHSNNAFIPPMI
jgi:Fic family protein